MAATPKNHTAIFMSPGTGRTKAVSVYDADVANGFNTLALDGKAGTGSLNFLTFPFTVDLIDFSVTTGTADTTVIQVLVNGVATGDIIDKVSYVSTNANRPPVRITVPAGARIQFKVLA